MILQAIGGRLMGTLGWLLVVAVGVALGYSVGRLWPGSAAKITELERQRDAAREDLRTYREDVSTHFERTAELFDKITADYRGLYEHLALGARQLGAIRGEAVEQRLAEPEQRRLATVTASPAPPPGDIEPPPEDVEPSPADIEPPPERVEPAPGDFGPAPEAVEDQPRQKDAEAVNGSPAPDDAGPETPDRPRE